MSLLSFKKFGYLEEMKDMLDYIIDDNELSAVLKTWEETQTIYINILRKDPEIYKKGNKNCPSNQESANYVYNFINACRKFNISSKYLAVFFHYETSEGLTKSHFFYIPISHLKNIEDSIKEKMDLTKKETSEIIKLWITSFEIQFGDIDL